MEHNPLRHSDRTDRCTRQLILHSFGIITMHLTSINQSGNRTSRAAENWIVRSNNSVQLPFPAVGKPQRARGTLGCISFVFQVILSFKLSALIRMAFTIVTFYQSATTILSAWITRQVARLLDELRLLLPQVDEGASLRSVLEQSLFFASRFR